MSNLYFHYPFCKQACHYCNFHFSTNQKEVDQLEEGMLKELDLRLTELKTPLESIYFGGGSPSLLSADKLSNLIHQSKAKFSFHDGIEITLEVNPDDVSKSYLKDVKEAGVGGLGAEFCFTSSHCMTVEGNVRYLPIVRTIVDSNSSAGTNGHDGANGDEYEYGNSDVGLSLSGIVGTLGYTFRF